MDESISICFQLVLILVSFNNVTLLDFLSRPLSYWNPNLDLFVYQFNSFFSNKWAALLLGKAYFMSLDATYSILCPFLYRKVTSWCDYFISLLLSLFFLPFNFLVFFSLSFSHITCQQILPPVINSFSDQDSRVRYYACEALYNIAKVRTNSDFIILDFVSKNICVLSHPFCRL